MIFMVFANGGNVFADVVLLPELPPPNVPREEEKDGKVTDEEVEEVEEVEDQPLIRALENMSLEDVPDPDDYNLTGPVVDEESDLDTAVFERTGDTSDGEVLSGDSVLPFTKLSLEECNKLLQKAAYLTDEERKSIFSRFDDTSVTMRGPMSASDVLGCGIKTGRISLWMIPYYIRFILEFLIGIAGLICVGGFVYGGFVYLFAGLSEDKDKGKKALFYSVTGLVVVMLAWAFVNIVIAVVTA